METDEERLKREVGEATSRLNAEDAERLRARDAKYAKKPFAYPQADKSSEGNQ